MKPFAFCSIHPPSLISSCSCSLKDGRMFLTRGNEILTSNLNVGIWTKPKIHSIFANIIDTCVIEDEFLTFLCVLTEAETLYLFDVKDTTFKCIQKSLYRNMIGDKVKKPILASSNKYIITHTRNRTLTIFELNERKLISNSFNVIIPVSKVYGICIFSSNQTRESSQNSQTSLSSSGSGSIGNFCVLGKDVKGQLIVSFYNIITNDIEFLDTITIDNSAKEPCITPINDLQGFVCAIGLNKSVLFIQNIEKQTTLEAKIPEITCLCQLNDHLLACGDAAGNLYTLAMHGLPNMEKKCIQLSRSSFLAKLPSDYFMQLSDTGDSHLLKYVDKKFIIYDTVGTLNSTKTMLRSFFITKQGAFRSLENGSLTIKRAQIDFKNGTRLWNSNSNNALIISTFNKTEIISKDDFSTIPIESLPKLKRDERTLDLYSDENVLVQITPKHCYFSSIKDEGNDLEFIFENEIFVASTDGKLAAVTYDQKIEILPERKIIELDEPVTALYVKESIILAATETTNSIFAFDNTTLLHKIELEDKNSTILSLGFTDDYENNFMATTFDSVYLINGFTKIKKIEPFHSMPLVRIISPNKLFICSSESGFINFHKKDDKDDCEVDIIANIHNDNVVDAIMLNDKEVALLTNNGIEIISIERHHHSHLAEQSIEDVILTCAAIDEADKCPPVFGGIMGADNILFNPQLEPAILPKGNSVLSMIWIQIDESPYLAVLCESNKQTIVYLYDTRLDKCCEQMLPGKPYAITYVDQMFIAVAHEHSISILIPTRDEIREEGKIVNIVISLTVSSSAPTRTACASLTSPNSCYLVYADEFSSVILYSVIDGHISEVARDMTIKKLTYAAAVSNNQILAVDKTGDAYILHIQSNALKTFGAFHIGSKVVAGFSSPPLTLITSSGSLVCMIQCSEKALQLYNTMRTKLKDCACVSNSEWRSVIKNRSTIPTEPFVDGDLLLQFNSLPQTTKENISHLSNISIDDIHDIVNEISNKVMEYRIKIQTGFSF